MRDRPAAPGPASPFPGLRAWLQPPALGRGVRPAKGRGQARKRRSSGSRLTSKPRGQRPAGEKRRRSYGRAGGANEKGRERGRGLRASPLKRPEPPHARGVSSGAASRREPCTLRWRRRPRTEARSRSSPPQRRPLSAGCCPSPAGFPPAGARVPVPRGRRQAFPRGAGPCLRGGPARSASSSSFSWSPGAGVRPARRAARLEVRLGGRGSRDCGAAAVRGSEGPGARGGGGRGERRRGGGRGGRGAGRRRAGPQLRLARSGSGPRSVRTFRGLGRGFRPRAQLVGSDSGRPLGAVSRDPLGDPLGDTGDAACTLRAPRGHRDPRGPASAPTSLRCSPAARPPRPPSPRGADAHGPAPGGVPWAVPAAARRWPREPRWGGDRSSGPKSASPGSGRGDTPGRSLGSRSPAARSRRRSGRTSAGFAPGRGSRESVLRGGGTWPRPP